MKNEMITSPNCPQIKVIHVCGKTKQNDPDGVYVNTTSKGGSLLSPFRLGPCFLYGTKVSQNMENGYQYSKVWSEHIGPDGLPTPDYFKWSDEGFENKKSVRYPMGKERRKDYEFHYWDGKMISRIEGRKMIYVPLYYQSVIKTDKYQELKQTWETIQKNGHGTLYLMEFDDYPTDGMSLSEILNNPDQSLGHGQVLKMMLLNDPCLMECHLRPETEFVTCDETVDQGSTTEKVEKDQIKITPDVQGLIDTVTTLHKRVLKLETQITSFKKKSLRDGLVIGGLLSKIKDSIPFGKLGTFIKTNLRGVMSHSTFNRYLNLFLRKDEIDETVVSLRSAYIKLKLIKELPETVDLTLEDQPRDRKWRNLIREHDNPKPQSEVGGDSDTVGNEVGDDTSSPQDSSKNEQKQTDQTGTLSLCYLLTNTNPKKPEVQITDLEFDNGELKCGKVPFDQSHVKELYDFLTPFVEWYNKESLKMTPIDLTEPTQLLEAA